MIQSIPGKQSAKKTLGLIGRGSNAVVGLSDAL